MGEGLFAVGAAVSKGDEEGGFSHKSGLGGVLKSPLA
jgi:hypothetical protein